MTTPSGGPWNWSTSGRRRGNPNLRVSDAERTEVADRLSEHYGAGRLDQAELNERLERAMRAKTYADFDGLLDDLPVDEPRSASPPRPPRRPGRALRPVLLFLVALVLLTSTGHLVVHPFFFLPVPWLLLAIVAAAVVRRRRRWRYGCHDDPH